MRKKKDKSNSFSNKYDVTLCFCVALATIVGLTAIASATKSLETPKYIVVQGVAILIGFLVILIGMRLNLVSLSKFSPYIICFNILILVLVLFIGTGDEVGTKGWIRFGSIGIQPSEIVKVMFIFTFAWHIDKVKEKINEIKTLLLLVAHAGIIIFLVLLQPDYGTAMVFITIAIFMLFIAKISCKYIFATIGTGAVLAPLLWFFVLKDFQKNRFFAFLNPEADPLGAGYHVSQSKIAIGSGQIFGKGLFGGIQTQLGHLPEKQTDFVFAVIGEEFGFIGAIIILILLLLIMIRCFQLAQRCDNLFAELICSGVGAMFLFHIFENVGMCIGLTPVTGIPLPFISYGGSSMITSLTAIMLVLNLKNDTKYRAIKNNEG